ncbi:class I SAM-dependent methyltransferase [Mesobacillus boroniphilus]|uniref:Class I SAM-dependent methyltransferase n=1 Tax=Mesobacillus boroniphilus TaxID=308892 RepID=A0A944GW59_9BACI|nr:class I SAM-dependent methyltransferase [Mesobacillus boroniphilus]MBS8264382.1 class I SAM-dependent methyltransferase [Mesobacillus boroniphilus]
MNNDTILINKKSWDEVAPRFYGRTALPEYGPFAPEETELKLFGSVRGKKVLDIGCGSGHSLKYMNDNGAAELWGLDLSHSQISAAGELLKDTNVKLFQSPMELNPGLPQTYFDVVYSIFSLGWTTNLEQTLKNVHEYLKPGGVFIFSWEHPLFSRIQNTDDGLLFNKSYHEEGPYDHQAWNHPAIMQQYKVSTYINSLVDTGFKIIKMVEEARITDELISRDHNRWYNWSKVQSVPTTIIFKCEKH